MLYLLPDTELLRGSSIPPLFGITITVFCLWHKLQSSPSAGVKATPRNSFEGCGSCVLPLQCPHHLGDSLDTAGLERKGKQILKIQDPKPLTGTEEVCLFGLKRLCHIKFYLWTLQTYHNYLMENGL